MTIQITQNTNEALVVMEGSLDTLAVEQAEEKVKELEALAASMPLVVDCTNLSYISSSGLRLLLRLRKAACVSNNKVKLLNVNSNIMEILQITHFDKMFIIE